MATGHWRRTSARIIAKVLADTKGKDDREIRKALRDAYPFGERAMHPYKIWCDEVKRQRGTKKIKPRMQNGRTLDGDKTPSMF